MKFQLCWIIFQMRILTSEMRILDLFQSNYSMIRLVIEFESVKVAPAWWNQSSIVSVTATRGVSNPTDSHLIVLNRENWKLCCWFWCFPHLHVNAGMQPWKVLIISHHLSLGGWKRFTEPFLMSGQVSGVYAMLMWIDVDVVNEINAFPG